jgi:DNA-binding transcriptional MerR regulator
VKPIKRAGGRRYYRPGDMLLLGGIKKLLYEDGLTIKGVQKILREEGMSHVSDMSGPLDELTLSQIGDTAPIAEAPSIHIETPEEEPRGVVLNFENATTEPDLNDTSKAPESKAETADFDADEAESSDAPVMTNSGDADTLEPAPEEASTEPESVEQTAPSALLPVDEKSAKPETPDASEPAPEPLSAVEDTPKADAEASKPEQDTAAALPSFMRRPTAPDDEPAVSEAPAAEPPTEPEAQAPEPEAPPAPKPRKIAMPNLTPEAEIAAAPALLTAAHRARSIDRQQAADIAPLLHRLTSHRDSMAARRNGGRAPAPKT